jgi:hypothetical protein
MVKYGVVGLSAFMQDLQHWSHLYVAGRLHKPVALLASQQEAEAAYHQNLRAALSTALLLLPKPESSLKVHLVPACLVAAVLSPGAPDPAPPHLQRHVSSAPGALQPQQQQRNNDASAVEGLVGGVVAWLAGHAHLSCLSLRQWSTIGVDIHTFIHPFIHSFIHPFIHPFFHSIIHSWQYKRWHPMPSLCPC